ncbi:MAG: hypothetical protein L3J91_02440, partial [Thermoplasmata archaeon]|nr:hypothetical protein [Thermoplasmata archaeon]
MRVPRGEAAGDRHIKRMSSWESAPITLRDLTAGVASAAKGKENVPLVLQYARDHQDAKLLPISRRVDLVEGPRVKAHLADPERQGGRDRRKEMWRIATAMESAALLLQRARGRHVPVNVETAKRAQEYLQARLPESDPRQVAPEPAIVAPAVVAAPPGQVPPWLQKLPERPAPPPPETTPEVVPVSTSDDPSLLPASTRPPVATPGPPAPARPAGAVAPIAVAPTSTPLIAPTTAARPAAPSIDPVALKIQIEGDLLRLLEERIHAIARTAPPPGPATALDEKLAADLDARADARIAIAVQQVSAQMTRGLEALDARQNVVREQRLAQAVQPMGLPSPAVAIDPKLQAEIDARADAKIQAAVAQLSTQISLGMDSLEARQTRAREERLAAIVKPPPPPGPASAIDPKLQAELDARADGKIQSAIAQLSTQISRDLEGVETRQAQAREERISTVLKSAGPAPPATAIDPRLQTELDARTETKIMAAVQQLGAQITKNLQTIEDRQGRQRDERLAATDHHRPQRGARPKVRFERRAADLPARATDRRADRTVDRADPSGDPERGRARRGGAHHARREVRRGAPRRPGGAARAPPPGGLRPGSSGPRGPRHSGHQHGVGEARRPRGAPHEGAQGGRAAARPIDRRPLPGHPGPRERAHP